MSQILTTLQGGAALLPLPTCVEFTASFSVCLRTIAADWTVLYAKSKLELVQASVAGALSRDVIFARTAPSTYALQANVTMHK